MQFLEPENNMAPPDLSHWMSDLPDELRKNIPIIHLAIPGSHDSMTYSIGCGAKAAPDADRIIARLNNFLPCVVRRWARTQNLDTAQQLRAGIRYFDLRISVRRKERQFYFVHGLFAEPFSRPLKEIANFLALHPSEFVILDCQHFYALDDKDYARLTNELDSLIGGMAFGPEDGALVDLTLSKARSMRKQIIVIFRNDQHIRKHYWPGSVWPTPWPDKIRVKDLERYLNSALQTRPANGGYVSQCVLTPPATFILTRFYSSLRGACAETVRRNLFDWLRAQQPGPYTPGSDAATVNVLIADFVELNDGEFCKSVVALNRKLLRNCKCK